MTLSSRLNAMNEALVRRMGKASQLDGVAESLSGVVDRLFGAPPVRDALSGTAIGHPLHPVLIVGPIGAFASASLLDFGNNESASQALIAAGIVAAIPTAASGLSDWRYTSGVERRIGLVHAAANTVALALYGASLVARRRRASGRLLALAGLSVLGVSGYLGGHLAYALGVGVDTNSFGAMPKEWTAVANETEVTDALTSVPLNGVNLLLTRAGGEVVVMANRCSHRGGPLADGERQADCVVCPWHKSTFDLKDGSVVTGPAVRPQMSLDVKVSDGQVMVRHRSDDSDLSTDVDAMQT